MAHRDRGREVCPGRSEELATETARVSCGCAPIRVGFGKRGAIFSRRRGSVIHPGFRLMQDGLAAAHEARVVAANSQGMAEALEFGQGCRRDARFDADVETTQADLAEA